MNQKYNGIIVFSVTFLFLVGLSIIAGAKTWQSPFVVEAHTEEDLIQAPKIAVFVGFGPPVLKKTTAEDAILLKNSALDLVFTIFFGVASLALMTGGFLCIYRIKQGSNWRFVGGGNVDYVPRVCIRYDICGSVPAITFERNYYS